MKMKYVQGRRSGKGGEEKVSSGKKVNTAFLWRKYFRKMPRTAKARQLMWTKLGRER